MSELKKAYKRGVSKSLEARIAQIIQKLGQAKNHEERSKFRRQITALGDQCATALIPYLKDDDDFLRWDIISFLGEFAHPATLDAVVRFSLSEKEVHARWRSFWAVTRFDKALVTAKLLQSLKSKESDVRWNAALILNMLDREEALPEILKGLKSKSNWVIWEALSALKSFGLPGTEKEVGRFINTTYNRDLRQEAVLALGRIGTSQALSYLSKALDDPSHHVRWRASFSMVHINHPEVLPLLRNRLQKERNQEVVQQIKSDIQQLQKNRNHGQKKITKTPN